MTEFETLKKENQDLKDELDLIARKLDTLAMAIATMSAASAATAAFGRADYYTGFSTCAKMFIDGLPKITRKPVVGGHAILINKSPS